ncbi:MULTISPECIES: acyltransferase [Cryobacterium]|uniref:Acyltransferase n=1 Tax=Cryobacterium breve TaxID=1259258 RepID=A0ABY2IZC2_9MICO|nr:MULTISPECIES: acyltransferase [Cryobacterium]TFC93285.1 acyltransferase [Cryobacterium sp. TmT3-12]TFC97859.1 acyltransferase [Cryobacterium breve]
MSRGIGAPSAPAACLASIPVAVPFLLFRPFVSAVLNSTPTPRLGRYLFNRCLRIFPAYIAILLFVSLVAGVAYLKPPELGDGLLASEQPVGYLIDPLLLLPNALMLQTFFPTGMTTGISVAWSLSVEMIFYIVMPMLALLAYAAHKRFRAGRLAAAVMPIVALLITGVLGKVWLALVSNPNGLAELRWLEWGGNWVAVLARSFVVSVDLFASGMIAAVIFCLISNGSIRKVLPWRWGALILGLLSIPVAWYFGFLNLGFSILSGAVILFVTTNGKGSLATLLERRPFRFAGDISYSVYLWHIPVTLMLFRFGLVFPSTVFGWLANVVLVMSVTGVLSWTTYRYVEYPFAELKKRTDARRTGARRSELITARSSVTPINLRYQRLTVHDWLCPRLVDAGLCGSSEVRVFVLLDQHQSERLAFVTEASWAKEGEASIETPGPVPGPRFLRAAAAGWPTPSPRPRPRRCRGWLGTGSLTSPEWLP